jgi:glycosyltransferase involved in cell wall biosynthesis
VVASGQKVQGSRRVPTLSVVIPAYNEEQGIADVLGRTIRACSGMVARVPGFHGYEVIVVNDGSRDKTGRIVTDVQGVRLIEHPVNRGYGAALKTGFEASTGDYIAFLDADGTYPPECLPELLRAAMKGDVDLVIGSRLSNDRSGMPLLRKVGNAAFALLLSWIVARKVTDTASGMRIIRRDILSRLVPLPDGLDLTPAMSTIALHEGLRVVEVPIPYDKRVGRSKLSIVKDGVRFLRTIVGLAETYNPLKFFGVVGAAMLGVAFLLGIKPVVHYFWYREVPLSEIYRLLTVIVLAVTGLNAITFGLAANQVIALVRGNVGAATRRSGRLEPGRFRKLGPIGLVLIASALLLNGQAIYNYVTTLRVGVHWSYVLTGAFLFLTGAHLVMISRLIRVFEVLSANVIRGPEASRSMSPLPPPLSPSPPEGEGTKEEPPLPHAGSGGNVKR